MTLFLHLATPSSSVGQQFLITASLLFHPQAFLSIPIFSFLTSSLSPIPLAPTSESASSLASSSSRGSSSASLLLSSSSSGRSLPLPHCHISPLTLFSFSTRFFVLTNFSSQDSSSSNKLLSLPLSKQNALVISCQISIFLFPSSHLFSAPSDSSHTVPTIHILLPPQ